MKKILTTVMFGLIIFQNIISQNILEKIYESDMEKYKKQIIKKSRKKLNISKNVSLDIFVFFEVSGRNLFKAEDHSVNFFLNNVSKHYYFRTFVYNDSLGIGTACLDKVCFEVDSKQDGVMDLYDWKTVLPLISFLKKTVPDYFYRYKYFIPNKHYVKIFM
jgi:hypothetical protein